LTPALSSLSLFTMFAKPHLKWNTRASVDTEVEALLSAMRPGQFESSTKHKAFNVEKEPGRRVLVESPVLLIPYGASSEMRDKETGKITQQDRVSFKAELDLNKPEHASFIQFLDKFDARA